MPTRPREYYRPTAIADALRLLENPDAAPLGGGTRLLAGNVQALIIVDLQELGLSGIGASNSELRIGATTRLQELEESDFIPEVLQKAIHFSGANTFRNAATLGGVIGSRDPNSEVLAVLLVLNAYLTMADGRNLTLPEYLIPDERPAGLITQITIPISQGTGALYRVARTPADYPIVSVVGWLPNGENIQLAAVGIAAYPLRLPDVKGDSIPDAILDIQDAVTHAGDFRGSREYRREMLGVLARRVIDDCLMG